MDVMSFDRTAPELKLQTDSLEANTAAWILRLNTQANPHPTRRSVSQRTKSTCACTLCLNQRGQSTGSAPALSIQRRQSIRVLDITNTILEIIISGILQSVSSDNAALCILQIDHPVPSKQITLTLELV